MTHRDANGHFISDEEWEIQNRNSVAPTSQRTSVAEDEDEEDEDNEPIEGEIVTPAWGEGQTPRTIFIDTGRSGQTAEVRVGDPFQETVKEVSERAHYGGYFRVYLNGTEVVNPEDAPRAIESGMRIALTPYDKVG